VLAPGSPASYAIFTTGSPGMGAAGLLDAAGPLKTGADSDSDSDAGRSGIAGLPDLAAGGELPRCLRTVVRGVEIFDSGELP
jgi:hypothetical protein